MKANTWIRNCFILAKDSQDQEIEIGFHMKHKLQYTEIGQFYTGILMYCDACTRKKYDLPPKTNTSFPKLDGAQRWSWN